MVARDQDNFTAVSAQETVCKLIKELSRNGVLIAHHLLPVFPSHARPGLGRRLQLLHLVKELMGVSPGIGYYLPLMRP